MRTILSVPMIQRRHGGTSYWSWPPVRYVTLFRDLLECPWGLLWEYRSIVAQSCYRHPYGMDFPVITMRDIVHAQCALVKHLGVRELAMVAGGSIGGQQALEWAVTYPEMVRKVRLSPPQPL